MCSRMRSRLFLDEDGPMSTGTRSKDLGVEEVARRARAAALELAACDTRAKNAALDVIRARLEERRDAIIAANRADKSAAEAEVQNGVISRAAFKRLDLEGEKFAMMIAGIEDVRRLADPVGQVSLATRLDDGLDLYRVSCPIGVIGVIFEARPEAAAQIASLALKSSNAVILKGGREAARSNAILVDCFREALASTALPVDSVQLVSTRDEVRAMLELDEWIDLVIPRGSNELVRSIQANTKIPVLGHADGICAVYLDRAADADKAVRIVVDAKAQYPAVCNAAETLLVHRDIAETMLPVVTRALSNAGVVLKADERALPWCEGAVPASDADFDTEFLELVLAVKVVDSIGDAIGHINRHGSHHTDAIVTEDREAAERFLAEVDSAGVFHNASTRFADGFRYGLGAEVGVSTNKTHARGPVGLEGLVIYKYRLYGNGHRVADYGPSKRAFRHAPISHELP